MAFYLSPPPEMRVTVKPISHPSFAGGRLPPPLACNISHRKRTKKCEDPPPDLEPKPAMQRPGGPRGGIVYLPNAKFLTGKARSKKIRHTFEKQSFMTYDWFKCEFSAADLNGKTVDFVIPGEDGKIMHGDGRLEAVQDARGYIRAAIILHLFPPGGGIEARKIFIPAEAASKFVRNPSGSKCEFSVNAF